MTWFARGLARWHLLVFSHTMASLWVLGLLSYNGPALFDLVCSDSWRYVLWFACPYTSLHMSGCCFLVARLAPSGLLCLLARSLFFGLLIVVARALCLGFR
jgi:hypothetical protein